MGGFAVRPFDGLRTGLVAVTSEKDNTMNAMKAIFLTAATLVCAVGCGLWPGGSDIPSDPIEFTIHLATLGREKNWEEIRDLMVEEFRDFDLEALEWAVRFQSISPTVAGSIPGYDDPDSWRVQPFGEAVIVQSKQAPPVALTLRKTGDGDLEFDPGPRARRWAKTGWINSMPAVLNGPTWTPRP